MTTNAHLYLRSFAEIGFNASDVPYVNEVDPDADSVVLPVYTDNNSRVKKTYNGSGSAGNWWLRSPDPTSSTIFRIVGNNGGAYSNFATYAYGLSFGFPLQTK